MKLRLVPASVAAVLAAGLLLAACGSGDDDDAARTTTAATTAVVASVAPDTTAVADTTTAPDTTGAPDTAAPDTTSDGGSGGALDPCTLLTTDEVSTAIERPVGDPNATEPGPVPPGGSACLWTATETQGELAARTVSVDVHPWSEVPDDWKGNFPTAPDYVTTICQSSIDQLGADAATILDFDGKPGCRTSFITYVANDDTVVDVSVPNISDDPRAAQAAQDLATIIAGRI